MVGIFIPSFCRWWHWGSEIIQVVWTDTRLVTHIPRQCPSLFTGSQYRTSELPYDRCSASLQSREGKEHQASLPPHLLSSLPEGTLRVLCCFAFSSTMEWSPQSWEIPILKVPVWDTEQEASCFLISSEHYLPKISPEADSTGMVCLLHGSP